jgi:hypothetical protein
LSRQDDRSCGILHVVAGRVASKFRQHDISIVK